MNDTPGAGVWRDVDRYFTDHLLPPDPVLDTALRTSEEAGLPPISVSPSQGKLLHLLVRARRARSVLEIGTLGGYSTIWLARALPPDGLLVTLEAEERHAEVARANLARADLDEIVQVRTGPALDTLPVLAGEGAAAGVPYDVVFIDADKPNNPEYLGWALRLTRPGSLIVVDNVVRGGAVLDPGGGPSVAGTRRMTELIAAEPRLSATTVQTVGVKGYDGFLLAEVTG
ncbi:O-methyltransferase [Streptomyces sp. 7-21]|jgi:predicted O-methyltransferase YrrM|uniref:O-methyltransferase n=1 Tax=Streptomyces sp. 7-21 TaxID=2802283 RepID=UPI00191F052E|nr:O-methyltransferase [Streptomyces sp. 7-21]MBL1066310.1 O-methyltransferase [Streptomyces sp. 7-21]